MNAEKKKEYRAKMSEYQKAKYLEYLRKKYDALTPEKKAELFAKRKANYEKNKEKIQAYQRQQYLKLKNKEK
tara:strand:- start:172 stop:387 length:216 start_codon:yes stop_codon:yes gene_type:complete